MKSTGACCDKAARLKEELGTADAVVIGAGSGLSTSAGFIYTGERFQKYFNDFIGKYDFPDMYSGGFYSFAWRSIGLIGAGISISIVIWIRRSQSTRNFYS